MKPAPLIPYEHIMTTKSKTPISQLDPTVVSEVFTRQVAILAMGGLSAAKIGERLGQSRATVEAIQKRDDYKAILKDVGERDLNFEVMRMKMRLTQMANQAAKVYEKVMQDYLDGKAGARDAVTVAQSVTRAMGIAEGEEQRADSQLTIVLPGGKEIVTVPSEVLGDKE